MPVLPIPMIFALVLGYLALLGGLRRKTPGILVALISLCGIQSFIIAMIQYYGIEPLRLVQPITAALIPPLAWLAFVQTAQRGWNRERDLPHLLIPLGFAFLVWQARHTLDAAIPALFLGYGVSLMIALRRGQDAMAKVRLENGDIPLWLWRFIALALIVSALSDVLIVYDQVAMSGRFTPWIISFISSLSLLSVGALGMSQNLEPGEITEAPIVEDPEERRQHAELMARLNAHMTDRAPYRDPDLTLGRLASRLSVPVKQLSTAVNRETGENVSRYVNSFRIAHATDLLRTGTNVTEAMFASGFNTKSNFNREFLRITGQSPSEWIKSQKAR